MRSARTKVFHSWLRMLGLTRQSEKSWHRARLKEELQERRLSKTFLLRLSETSDVLFCLQRAEYDGFTFGRKHALVGCKCVPGYAYMFAKFTSRWCFFRAAAFACNVKNYRSVCEVVNPARHSKVDEVACRHQIDTGEFQRACRRIRRFWPLLP